MAWKKHLLTQELIANGDIFPARVVKFDAAQNQVIQAAAASDGLLGIAYIPGVHTDTTLKKVAGDRVEVVLVGIAECVAGGNITQGQLLTSDANGKVVAAATGNNYVARAMTDAVDGDWIPVLLNPGSNHA